MSLQMTRVAIIATVLVAMMAAGCRSSGDSAVKSAGGLSDSALAELRKSAGDQQAEMLSDGVITFQQYETAILATIQCLSDAGISVGSPELRYKRKYYRYDWQFPDDRAEELFPKVEECTGRWRPVVDGWYIENMATEKEVGEARAAFVSCLRDAGVDLPSHPTEQDFDRLRRSPTRDFLACSDEISEEYGLIGFAG